MDACGSLVQVGHTQLAEDSRRSRGEPEIHQPRRCHFRMDAYSPTWPMEWSLVNSLPKSSNSLAVTKPQAHESGRSTSSTSEVTMTSTSAVGLSKGQAYLIQDINSPTAYLPRQYRASRCTARKARRLWSIYLKARQAQERNPTSAPPSRGGGRH